MKKTMQRNAIAHLATVMWRNAEGCRGWVVLYAVMAALAVLAGLVCPLVIAKLMNAVQTLSGDALVERSEWLLGLYVLLGLLFWALHGPARVIETTVAFTVKRAFQTRLFRKVTALPMSWHRDHHSGETIDQVAKASQALGDFTECGFEVIHLLTRFAGAIAVLTWLMPPAGLAVLIVGGLAVFAIVLFDRRLIIQYTALNKRFNEVAAAIQDYLTNVATVISLRLEKRVTGEIDERTGKILPLYKRNSITNELKWFTTSRFVDLTQAGILLAYIILAVKTGKLIEVGTMYALSEYLRSIGDSFFQFTARYGDLVVKSTRVHGVDHIEEAFDREVRASEAAQLPKGWHTLRIEGLRFSHGSADAPTIADVSLRLEAGRSYALVGESGSGKSTVLGLIRGIHRANEAQVSCDGALLPHGLAHVAHHSTLIPQDPEIFSDSMRFNVCMGVAAKDEDILRAVRLARFEQVLNRLPAGLATSIAEKGVSLSGGEKQRLALARGIFFAQEAGSEIVLLDEPTSSVDIFNERLIYETLLDHFGDRCVLSAIHKFNLLQLFDEVLVFAGGKLVERGSVPELIERGGEFARLWGNYHRDSEDIKVSA